MAWTRSLIACCCSSRTFGSARCWRRSKTWDGQQLNSQSRLLWAYVVVFGRERRGHCCECNGGLGVRRQPESANRRKRRARDLGQRNSDPPPSFPIWTVPLPPLSSLFPRLSPHCQSVFSGRLSAVFIPTSAKLRPARTLQNGHQGCLQARECITHRLDYC